MAKPGDRVFAVSNVTPDTVYLFGFGTYAGRKLAPGTKPEDLVPSEADIAESARMIQEMDADAANLDTVSDRIARENGATEEEIATYQAERAAYRARPVNERAVELSRQVAESLARNPRIDLDNGGHVWGFECWWGQEDRFEEIRQGRTVVEVDAQFNEKGPDDPAAAVERSLQSLTREIA